MDGLIELLDLHLHLPDRIHDPLPEGSPIKRGPEELVHDPRPSVIGAVPWLSHPGVIDRLRRLQSLVVVDKGQRRTSELWTLQKRGQPYPFHGLPTSARHPSWEEYARTDRGRPVVVDPGTPWPPGPGTIGPVRVAGHRGDGTPLVHTKLLVFGTTAWFKNHAYPEGGPPEFQIFRPRLMWWGSANWTSSSSSHLEMGVACDDPALVTQALDYLMDLVKLSEPLGSEEDEPTPGLAAVDFDDEAFRDYIAEYGPPREVEDDD